MIAEEDVSYTSSNQKQRVDILKNIFTDTHRNVKEANFKRKRKRGRLYFFYSVAALGLHCCAWTFSSCGERGLPFHAVRGLLIAVASLVEEHRL